MSKQDDKPDYGQIIATAAVEAKAAVFDIDSDEADKHGGLFERSHRLLFEFNDIDRQFSAWSDVGLRELFVATPIETELGATIALHEMGHIALSKPGQTSADVEARASEWALAHMPFKIGPDTATEVLSALMSYAEPGDACPDCTTIEPGSVAAKLVDELKSLGADPDKGTFTPHA